MALHKARAKCTLARPQTSWSKSMFHHVRRPQVGEVDASLERRMRDLKLENARFTGPEGLIVAAGSTDAGPNHKFHA